MTLVVHDLVWVVLAAVCVIAVILLCIATRHGLRLVWVPRPAGRARARRR